jgi:hypothetical protein
MKVTAWGRGAASASPARPCRSSDIAPQYSRKSLISMQSGGAGQSRASVTRLGSGEEGRPRRDCLAGYRRAPSHIESARASATATAHIPCAFQREELKVTDIAKCLRCGRDFERRHSRHIYCSRDCRYGKDPAERLRAPTPEQLKRLFDPTRDPESKVRLDDWHPLIELPNGAEWRELDLLNSVASRRRWYRVLRAEGRV